MFNCLWKMGSLRDLLPRYYLVRICNGSTVAINHHLYNYVFSWYMLPHFSDENHCNFITIGNLPCEWKALSFCNVICQIPCFACVVGIKSEVFTREWARVSTYLPPFTKQISIVYVPNHSWAYFKIRCVFAIARHSYLSDRVSVAIRPMAETALRIIGVSQD